MRSQLHQSRLLLWRRLPQTTYVELIMAISRLTRDEAWFNLVSIEQQYYQARAVFDLLEAGIAAPSKEKINSQVDHLLHVAPAITALAAGPLSPIELECLYYAACGKEVKEIAILINRVESYVVKLRSSVCHKLRSKHITEAVHRANQLGYLPLKTKPPLRTQQKQSEETEHAFS